MDTDFGTEGQDSTPQDAAPVEQGADEQAVENSQTTESTPGENPAWAAYKEALDPMTYERIKPILAKSDKDVQARFEKIHEGYKPYKDLIDNKVDPQRVQQSLSLVEQLESNPEFVYNSLKSFLQENGRLPESEEELEDHVDQENEEEAPEDPRIAQLEQWAYQQEQEKLSREAESWLDSEINRVKEAHPELTQEDMREVLQRAGAHAMQTGQEIESLDPYVQSVLDYQQSILTRPRPGDNAPNLVPSGGGIPNGKPKRTLGSLSGNETQDVLATMIDGLRG